MMKMNTLDLVVVGGGPAGLSAAAVVAGLGGRVLVLDESASAGGRLPGQAHPEFRLSGRPAWSSGAARARELLQKATAAGAEIRCGVSVWGISPGWFVSVAAADPSRSGTKLPAGFHAKAVLIASGASQNPMVFEGWTLPGVITAGAAQSLVTRHGVLPGRHAVVIGIDPLSLSTGWLLSACGADVKGILLPPEGYSIAPSSPSAVLAGLAHTVGHLPCVGLKLAGRLFAFLSPLAARGFPSGGVRVNGCRLMARRQAVCVRGDRRVREARVVTLDAAGRPIAGSAAGWEVDVVVTSAGLHPLTELAQAAGCPMRYFPSLGGWVPLHGARMETPLQGLFVAGSITGVEGAGVAEAQGHLAGLSVAQHLRLEEPRVLNGEIESAGLRVEEARASCLPFFPDVDRGRERLAAAWRSSGGGGRCFTATR
jgi:sarcosine oxidase subunit alpha